MLPLHYIPIFKALLNIFFAVSALFTFQDIFSDLNRFNLVLQTIFLPK